MRLAFLLWVVATHYLVVARGQCFNTSTVRNLTVIVSLLGTASCVDFENEVYTLSQPLTLSYGLDFNGASDGGTVFSLESGVGLTVYGAPFSASNILFLSASSSTRALQANPDDKGVVGDLTLTSCEFIGSGIESMGSLVMTDSRIANVTLASGNGAGLHVSRNEAFLSGVVIEHCIAASGAGGAVAVSGAPFNAVGCTFQHNFASGNGGALFINGLFPAIVNGSLIFHNSVNISQGGEGGGLYATGVQTVTVEQTQVLDNSARYGGGLCVYNVALTFEGSEGLIALNSVSGDGGGVYCGSLGTTFILRGGASIMSNSAYGGGGGIAVTTEAEASFTGSGSVAFNFASEGGGLSVRDDSTVVSIALAGGVFNNTAGSRGGGFFIFSTPAVFLYPGTIVSHNKANDEGGGMCLSGSDSFFATLLLGNGVVFSHNSAVSGGGLYSEGSLVVDSLTVAYSEGGGVAVGGGLLSNLSITHTQSGYAIEVLSGSSLETNHGNVTDNDGSGFYVAYDASLMLTDFNILRNRACESAADSFFELAEFGILVLESGEVSDYYADARTTFNCVDETGSVNLTDVGFASSMDVFGSTNCFFGSNESVSVFYNASATDYCSFESSSSESSSSSSINSSSSSSFTSSSTLSMSTTEDEAQRRLSTGATVGISAAAVAGVGLIVILLLALVKKGGKSNKVEPTVIVLETNDGSHEEVQLTLAPEGES